MCTLYLQPSPTKSDDVVAVAGPDEPGIDHFLFSVYPADKIELPKNN